MSDTPMSRGLERRIFWISVLGLFLELLLIRWIGTEIRIFAYLQNTVLVVCFLGLGLGLFTSREPARFDQVVWPLAILTALLAIPLTRQVLASVSENLSVLGDMRIWGEAAAESPVDIVMRPLVGLLITFAVMALIVRPFIPIGRLLGRWMDEHRQPIRAYSINVAGSLVGIWLFVLLSWWRGSPLAWFAVLGLLLFPFLNHDTGRRRIHVVGIALIVLLSRFTTDQPGATETVWSPYQKLALSAAPGPAGLPDRHDVRVNNVGYQVMLDLRPETLAKGDVTPGSALPHMQIGYSQYDIPTHLKPGPRRVLIVGAGTGNDAAGALRGGAEQIVAVEIDPAIVEFGARLHPERPYDSDRVEVVIDDARSYMARADKQFDLIVFGLLDSHTTTAMTNARLDHYVYTRESISRAKQLLADGGLLVLSFEVQKAYIADRMATVLRDVFGEPPLAFTVPYNALGWGGVMFAAGNLEAARARIAEDPSLTSLIAWFDRMAPVNPTYTTQLATDDWPYIYLERPSIPALYILLAVLLLALLASLPKAAREGSFDPRSWARSEWHFFFLGAAFLLLEVQNISKAAVVLGNTWLVNAVIISGILGMVLIANAIAARWRSLPILPVYAALLGSALGLYFVDLARFAFLPFGVKAAVVGGLTTLPMLFSGIVFVRSFAAAGRKDVALGANLFGALVGALLQSISFVTGIRSLLLIVTGLYALAMFTRTRAAVGARAPASGTEPLASPAEA